MGNIVRSMLQLIADADGVDRRTRVTYLKMLEALVAGDGFEAVAALAAAAVGAPVEILVPRPGSEGTVGSPTERYVAQLVAGERPEAPETVGAVVPIASGGTTHGAVVMHGPGGPEADAMLRAAAIAALTGVAILDARDAGGGGQEGDSLLADLLEDVGLGPAEVSRRARARGFDLGPGVRAVAIQPRRCRPEEAAALLGDALPTALVEVHEGRVFALLPDAAELPPALSRRMAAIGQVATSSHYPSAGDVGTALEESRVLLEIGTGDAPDGGSPPGTVAYQLLFRFGDSDPATLACFSQKTVGAVLAHDAERGGELITTLSAYVTNNCNMNKTAEETYTHRHTVANRLARIQELSGLDPFVAEDRQLLHLGLMAHRVVSRRRRTP